MTAQSVAVFDFDGTLSTLRSGWEQIMAPFMRESIVGSAELVVAQSKALDAEINRYIDESTGIQTIYQMRWLTNQIRHYGLSKVTGDEWDYKAEYNRRLLRMVRERVERLEQGGAGTDDYMIKGARRFLQVLKDHGLKLYLASGTDHDDVVNEARVLGVSEYFQRLEGAPAGIVACSKEKVLHSLMERQELSGRKVTVIGDGKVEIGLGKAFGALSIGLASDEEKREGYNPDKERRLKQAGADVIFADYTNLNEWLSAMGLA